MKIRKSHEKAKLPKVKLPGKKKIPPEYGPIEIRMLSEEEAADEFDCVTEHELIEELNGSEGKSDYKFESNRKYFTICIYALVTIIAASIFICLIANFGDVKLWFKGLANILSPFIAAFLIAFILNPLVCWLEVQLFQKLLHLEKPRLRVVLSILTTYILSLGIIIIGLVYVIPQITNSIVNVASDVSTEMTKLYENREHYTEMLEQYFPGVNLQYIEDKIEEMWPELIGTVTNVTKNIVPADRKSVVQGKSVN